MNKHDLKTLITVLSYLIFALEDLIDPNKKDESKVIFEKIEKKLEELKSTL
jgi:hypothetical protein